MALILFIMFTTGCSVSKTVDAGGNEITLSRKQRLEYEYAFLEAHRAKISGDLHKSAALFHKCIKIHPKSDAAYYELSNLYFAFEDLESAIGYAKGALKLDWNNKWYYFQLARIYQANKQADKAVEVYRELVKRFPGEHEYNITLAGLLDETGNHQEAIEILDETERYIGITETVTLTKHNLYLRKGNYEKAFNEIQKLISAFPDDVRYLGILAELYGRLGMDRQALETYQKILKIDYNYAIAHFSIAEFYRSRGMLEECFVHLAKAFRDENIGIGDKISTIAGFFDSPEILSNYKVQIGQLVELVVASGKEVPQARLVAADFFLRTENIARAVIELKVLTELIPDNYPVMEQLIISLSFIREYKELIRYGKVANERFPGKIMIHYFLGIAYFQNEEYQNAADILVQGEKLEEGTAEIKNSIRLLIGDSLNKLKNYTGSDEWFEKVLERDPDNTIALNNWSYYLALREEQIERAERMSRKTIEKEPMNSTYLDTYAWVLFKMKEFEKALYYIELAMKFKEEPNAEILDHYGDILLMNGKRDEAVNVWREAYRIDNQRNDIMRKIEMYE